MRRSMPKNKGSTRYFSSAQEEAVAELVGGVRSPNSGAGHFAKGDVCTPSMLIECKTVEKPRQSVSIKQDWLKKNELEAFERRIPNHALAFRFAPDGEDYFVIDSRLFKWLCGKLSDEDM